MIQGHIDISPEGLDSLINTTSPHTGERFSGWRPEYDITDYPWVTETLELIGRESGLGEMYPQGIWINVLKGAGAEIEEHDEGYNDGDVTIVLFLSDSTESDGGQLIVEGKSIRPQTGNYVVFPSKTKHRVNRLETEKPRVSVAAIFKKE